MNKTRETPALAGNRGNDETKPSAKIIALPSSCAPGSLHWRQARGLMTWRDYIPKVADDTITSYDSPVAEQPVTRFSSWKTRRTKRATQSAFFHTCKFMVGCVGRPSGLPEPCPGLLTRRNPPPLCCLAAAWWRPSTLTRSLP